MKKLFLIVAVLMVTSCTVELKPVNNPEEFTSVEMTKLHKDTVVMAIKDNTVYIFDGEVVKYALQTHLAKVPMKNLVPINFGIIVILGIIVIVFLLFIVLGYFNE